LRSRLLRRRGRSGKVKGRRDLRGSGSTPTIFPPSLSLPSLPLPPSPPALAPPLCTSPTRVYTPPPPHPPSKLAWSFDLGIHPLLDLRREEISAPVPNPPLVPPSCFPLPPLSVTQLSNHHHADTLSSGPTCLPSLPSLPSSSPVKNYPRPPPDDSLLAQPPEIHLLSASNLRFKHL